MSLLEVTRHLFDVPTKAIPGQPMRVLSVDTGVHTDQKVTRAHQITPKGGAGTDMAAGITTAARTRPAAIIVITDGYTPWPPTPPPGARGVIAALTNSHTAHRVPAWIQTINITNDA